MKIWLKNSFFPQPHGQIKKGFWVFLVLAVSKNLYLVNMFHFWSQGLKLWLKQGQNCKKWKNWTLSTKFGRSATATGKELFSIGRLLVKRKNHNSGRFFSFFHRGQKRVLFQPLKLKKRSKKIGLNKWPLQGTEGKKFEFFLV